MSTKIKKLTPNEVKQSIKVIKIIFKDIAANPSKVQLYLDVFAVIKPILDVDSKQGLVYTQKLKDLCKAQIMDNQNVIALAKLADSVLLSESRYSFDSYMLCLEQKRLPKDRFYLPRRKQLLPTVIAIQELVDDELDEVFLSMPPRVGKTTLLMLFTTWIIGRNSEASNLYSAFSDIITSAFYSGIVEVITDVDTYNWHTIFPNASVKSTNGKDETLNIDRNKRYPSITCRSLYGTLNGACDCTGFLISDDLIGGIEEALNKDRLNSAWTKVDNNLIPRSKESAKLLWCGTRWSLADPEGRRMAMLNNNPEFKNRRYKIINLPALDENGESNFDYLYNVGFSTNFYHERRASFENQNDMPSWNAQYMGEPVERSGLLFPLDSLKTYNGVLPQDKDGKPVTPDRIFAPIDVAWGGGDYLSMPIIYQYGSALYLPHVVFDNGDKTITRPRVAANIVKHHIQAVCVEKNNGGGEYQEDIEELLQKMHYRCNITSKAANSKIGKEIRIYDNAPDIRDIYYLEPKHWNKEYRLFMSNLTAFSMNTRNKHDDAPDSLSQAIDMIRDTGGKCEVIQRMF